MASLGQSQQQRLRQKLTPQQLLVMQLIDKPVDQLEAYINEQINNNPLLEPADSNHTASDELPAHDTTENRLLSDEYDGDGEQDYTPRDDYRDEYDYRPANNDPSRPSRENMIVSEDSFADNLLSQLSYHEMSDLQRILCTEIIGSLDDGGYFRGDLAVVLNDLMSHGTFATMADAEQALRTVQSLDPAGVGARTLQECLLLQLRRQHRNNLAARNAEAIVEQYFDLFKNGNLTRIQQLLEIPDEVMREAVRLIRSLSFNPGGGDAATYVSPDFIVTQVGDHLRVSLADGNMPAIRFNQEYMQLLKQMSANELQLSRPQREEASFLQGQKREADNLSEALHLRQITMLRVMNAIVAVQEQFFRTGRPEDKVPLLQKDIAQRTGYDPSTISRVVGDKYAQTDFGLIPLSQCFSNSYTTSDGQEVSTEVIKRQLRELVDAEERDNPLTDDQLAALLSNQGYTVARRTVANYRNELGIPPRHLRRHK